MTAYHPLLRSWMRIDAFDAQSKSTCASTPVPCRVEKHAGEKREVDSMAEVNGS